MMTLAVAGAIILHLFLNLAFSIRSGMSIPKNFNPAEAENRLYSKWMEKGYFHSEPDEREAFTIVIPPPNVTGILHMGHILNNTIQDVLIRKARMEGKNACWVPGTDHASIATEAKVVKQLREQGITKADISREEFLEHAYAWSEKYKGIILGQLKRLGASCDWERERFTMDEDLNKSVVKVFVDLFRKGKLYRDLKMVNWDPAAQTTLSNEEVIYKEQDSKLYYVKYKVSDSEEWLTIATTRPETILGDTAICVHPEDERFKHLHGKSAMVPIAGRAIPIIADDYVDMEFGTGALKVTPAHDPNDYEIGNRHNLERIDIFNPDGSLNELAGHYIGKYRFEVRKLIIEDIEKAGQLVKVDTITNKVGYSERNPDTVIESRLSLQWFVDMEFLAKPALENVVKGDIEFFPEKFINTYKHWLENIRDWPISRQLWWGQQIPAWYYGEDGVAVAETEAEALEIARRDSGNPNLSAEDLNRDSDVVDTWFSSWLWPMSVFGGLLDPENEEYQYYYPTAVLVTGWDIIFFWVARMIMAGYAFDGRKPFSEVYFTGMVRDLQRRKMSKSLGNSPDALELMDRFGADGVRFGMLASAPAGNDLLFDEKLCDQGRNFMNKIWNALRLVKSWEVDPNKSPEQAWTADWFSAALNAKIKEYETSVEQYRLSEALMGLYTFIWDDFCSWYLEWVKPAFGEAIDQSTYDQTIQFFESLLKLLHPFMPFITEEIWQHLSDRKEGEDLVVANFPKGGKYDSQWLSQAEVAREVIAKIREFRTKDGVKQIDRLRCLYIPGSGDAFDRFEQGVIKLGGLESFETTTEEPEDKSFQSFVVKGHQFFLFTGVEIDAEAERQKIEEEMKYTQGFIKSVEKKLSNERFVSNAPEAVVEKERKKLADGQEKLKALEESLSRLN